jgi:hypothetical protein
MEQADTLRNLGDTASADVLRLKVLETFRDQMAPVTPISVRTQGFDAGIGDHLPCVAAVPVPLADGDEFAASFRARRFSSGSIRAVFVNRHEPG